MLLKLAGRIPAAAAPGFRSAIDAAVRDHDAHLVLDLGGLEYISSAGVRVLDEARARATEYGRRLVLFDVSESLRFALDLGGLGSRLTLADSREGAISLAREAQ